MRKKSYEVYINLCEIAWGMLYKSYMKWCQQHKYMYLYNENYVYYLKWFVLIKYDTDHVMMKL